MVLHDVECGFSMLLNVRFDMILNVGNYMITNVGMYVTTNLQPRLGGTAVFFICPVCFISNIMFFRIFRVALDFPDVILFQILMSFRYSSVPPEFSYVQCFLDNMNFRNSSVTTHVLYDSLLISCLKATRIQKR